MNRDLCYLPATELLELFRSREVSPVEVLRAQLERADEGDALLCSLVERMDDWALERACESERRYADGTALPLDGITVATKEKHAIAGYRVTEGSLAWEGYSAPEDHPVIERLRAAGAVFHARTSTPEFSIATYTHTKKWGITRNPWNPDFSPGGSSGGAGAAVAAGFTTLATVSDIGGSTRGPACFSAAVGYKAPYGRVPGAGPMTLDYYRGDGVMGRTVADTLLATNLVVGQHRLDQTSLPTVTISDDRDVRGMRIAFSPDLGGFAVDPEVVANARATANALAEAGAIVEEVRFGWNIDDLRVGTAGHFAQMVASLMNSIVGDRTALMNDYARNFLDLASIAREHMTMFDAVRAEYNLMQGLADAMDGYDALICPTSAAVGFPAGDTMADGIEINGTVVPWTEGLLTMPFNVNNRCPVLAMPSGFAANGMPTGVQVVGHPYDDDTVFAVGRALEELRGNPFAERRPATGG
ncbi:amidase [Tsukamurella sp. M9C]|uniref:amidase n=1 Tax=unclassified Tsukamurella TaxID=2633480 RepID=UPI001CCBE373|nr:amidase [Tsukamurella sp. M9C]MCA0156654.1 amidase [Tsukamurella sp. M9C]